MIIGNPKILTNSAMLLYRGGVKITAFGRNLDTVLKPIMVVTASSGKDGRRNRYFVVRCPYYIQLIFIPSCLCLCVCPSVSQHSRS